ncbi:MAG: PAS domain S-box protein [Candidatus Kapabacteria bacterium]|nr:PAS domain S-box protein [Candidatus Kapabacteria bacterium]
MKTQTDISKPVKSRTSQEQAKQLQKQVAWYKSFFDNAADAVFMIQSETWCVLDSNERASAILGVAHADLLGKRLPEFKHVFSLLSRSVVPTVLSEVEFENSNGNKIQLEVSARFIDYDGQRLILAIARDVTEQRALTDKMLQADKMMLLGQLSASVAHEIRNPLAAVNLNLQMLLRKISETEPHIQYVNTALRGVERILNIVNTTLNFAKPLPPRVTPVNLNSVVVDSIDLISDILLRKAIIVELDLDEELPVVSADVNQMQQVLINLLTNACDAITLKGEIIIKTNIEVGEHGKPCIMMRIKDNGMGISEEDLTKIFDPFFTRKAEGTGLGLAIIQRILQQHGCSIYVESIVGTGSTFTICFPLFS